MTGTYAMWHCDTPDRKKSGVLCPAERRLRHLMYVMTMTKTEVFEQYQVELMRFATSLVGPSDAPDVVSEALLRAMWSDGWPAVENQRAYLYRAVASQAKMLQRSAVRRRRRERRSALPDSVPAHDGQVDVWEALGRLNVSQRAAVFLTYWEDLTEVETARRLGLSERTVRRRLVRARDLLRGMLQ